MILSFCYFHISITLSLMNHLDEYVFPFMNSREIERLEIEQKVLNYYHYGSQILCGQFIESTSANWPSNTQKKIKMTQWNLYILDFTQKKKKIWYQTTTKCMMICICRCLPGKCSWNFMSNSTLLLSYWWHNYNHNMYL